MASQTLNQMAAKIYGLSIYCQPNTPAYANKFMCKKEVDAV